jgi:hypothetical protein
MSIDERGLGSPPLSTACRPSLPWPLATVNRSSFGGPWSFLLLDAVAVAAAAAFGRPRAVAVGGWAGVGGWVGGGVGGWVGGWVMTGWYGG